MKSNTVGRSKSKSIEIHFANNRDRYCVCGQRNPPRSVLSFEMWETVPPADRCSNCEYMLCHKHGFNEWKAQTLQRKISREEWRSRKADAKKLRNASITTRSDTSVLVSTTIRDPLAQPPVIKQKIKTRPQAVTPTLKIRQLETDWRRLQYVTPRGIG